MKRILLIAAMPLPREKGSSLRVMEIIRILAHEYHVDVICYGAKESAPEITNAEFFRTSKWLTPNFDVAKPGIIRFLFDFLLVWKGLLRRLRYKYDILQGEDFEGMCAIRVLSILQNKAKIVYDLHNFVSQNLRLSNAHRNFLLRKTLTWIEKTGIHRANLVILNWAVHQDANVLAEKNTLIFRDSFSHSYEQVKLPVRKYAVYAGNAEKYQGIEFLLESYRQSEQAIDIVLVGEMSKNVLEIIVDFGLQHKVYCPGRLSVAQTNYLIANATFCLWPIQIEARSMKVIHYLMHGKPILTTGIGDSDGLLKNGVNSVNGKSISEFVSLINELSKNPGYLAQLTKGAQKTKNELNNSSDPQSLYLALEKLC